MARRKSASPEISLFPFLSILVCVIGTLVLLIVVMTLGQTVQDGRTQAELDRAIKHQQLEKELEALKAAEKASEVAAGDAGKLLAALKQEQAKLINLRRDMEKLGAAPPGGETDAELQKRLELAISQLAAMAKERPEMLKEIQKLEAELQAKKKVLSQAPPLKVRPGGTGSGRGADLLFVEANGAGVVLYKDGKPGARVSKASVGKDAGLNAFFLEAKKNPRNLVLFLVREDGYGTYNMAAGLAENTFELRTGKLPLPGQGPVDLSLFQK